ncbi:MAG TPA: VOC family protein [Xanthobacteraceae bacterium]|jgi:catechol 2,3-dioxygenase-like lactoylglutathione lyase family enzyme
MIDHVSIGVRDLERAARFYQAVLATIGYRRLREQPHTVGFGKTYPELWINLRRSMTALDRDSGSHVAVRAPSVQAVDGFHAAALAAGGDCEGPPGPRPEYSPAYYAAFIRDPDGNRIEVVTFRKA